MMMATPLCRKRMILCSIAIILVQICDGISIQKVEKKTHGEGVKLTVKFEFTSPETCSATWMAKNGAQLDETHRKDGSTCESSVQVEHGQGPVTVFIGNGMNWTRLTIRDKAPYQSDVAIPAPVLQIGLKTDGKKYKVTHSNVYVDDMLTSKPLYADVFMFDKWANKIIKTDIPGSGLFYVDKVSNDVTELGMDTEETGVLTLTYEYEEPSLDKLVQMIQVGRSTIFPQSDVEPFPGQTSPGVAHLYSGLAEKIRCSSPVRCEVSCVAGSSGDGEIEVTISRKDGTKLVSATKVGSAPLTRIAFPAKGNEGDYICDVRYTGDDHVIDSRDITVVSRSILF